MKKVRDQHGREGIILKKLANSPTIRKKARWSPVTQFSTRSLQQQLEDQHESIPQAEQAYKVQFGTGPNASIEVKLESELEFL
jgi:hypothetical protein